ncbi:MAG: 1-acyl-sn-glycerol-3-phosphate acyltransferase [Bacteroidota bacterium]
MLRLIFKIIFKLNKWTLDDALMKEGKITRCVMIGAPHTSNWDMIYMVAAFQLMKIPLKFTLKKEWLRFPLNFFMAPLGAIGIDRSPKDGSTTRRSMVEVMTELFDERKELIIVFSPEGSRSIRDKWRTGFYYTALSAKVPIMLGYLDYKEKRAGIGKMLYPTGDVKKDMKTIMDFYAQFTPRYPELFVLDKEYVE